MAHGWRMTGFLMLGANAALVACVAAPGCSKPSVPAGFERVVIAGRPFTLELVADDATRMKGLGDRTSIPEDGGMLFSFPDSRIRQFVMRDCLVPIDIIFLDADGRIVAMHHMPIEDPKRDDEDAMQYELRLARYSSRYNARYAIELKGGMLENLDLQAGQQIRMDTKRLAEITE